MDEGGAARGAFRRLTAVAQELRLFGPGDPFIDALWEFTELDDRGRAFAVWRAREYWAGRADALAVGLDVRVRPDIAEAASTLATDATDAVRAALRRRAESYLAPLTVRVWFDARGTELKSERLLTILNAPYSDRQGDQTIRPEAWHLVADHVGVEGWGSFCRTLRDSAPAVMSARPGFQERCQVAADQALFDCEDGAARLLARSDYDQAAAADDELRLGHALVRGMLAPAYEVDAAGVVVMSSKPLPREDD
jgi:ATP-dependent helicase HepA